MSLDGSTCHEWCSCQLCPHRTLIFWCAGLVIVRGDQKLNPSGNQAPIMKASRCRNERWEGLAGGKRVVRKGRKKLLRMLLRLWSFFSGQVPEGVPDSLQVLVPDGPDHGGQQGRHQQVNTSERPHTQINLRRLGTNFRYHSFSPLVLTASLPWPKIWIFSAGWESYDVTTPHSLAIKKPV